MTNPYSVGNYSPQGIYSPQYQQQYAQQNIQQYPQEYPQEYQPDMYISEYQQPPKRHSTLGLMTLGALGGGTVGYLKFRHPVSADQSVSEKFTKTVFYRNLAKNCPKETKTYFKQLKDVLNKIDKIKTPEAFKKLVEKNKALFDEHCKAISTENLLDGLNSSNLKASKASFKDTLNSILNFEFLKTKNAIRLAWDPTQKKFIKTPEFKDDKLFKIIKNAKRDIQWNKAFKYGGITAGIVGALSLGYKWLTTPRNV